MDLVAGVVGGAVGLVQSGYKTVNAKMGTLLKYLM